MTGRTVDPAPIAVPQGPIRRRRASMKISDIRVGGRDREDNGDLTKLATSIRNVGLLHPVVVTADGQLIAGGRRLAAAVSLGWTDIPATVLDLSNAEDLLRAELDENVCREDLTAYEASRARARRAAALAPTKTARVGRPKNGSNLDPLPEGKTRKLAAIGTGYSGSTLDKVDLIKAAAEDGAVTLAGQTIRVPEPVRAAAVESLAAVKKTGAAIETEHQKVRAALSEFLQADPERAAYEHRKKLRQLAGQVLHGLPVCDIDAIVGYVDEPLMRDFENASKILSDWVARVKAARPKSLRLIGAPE